MHATLYSTISIRFRSVCWLAGNAHALIQLHAAIYAILFAAYRRSTGDHQNLESKRSGSSQRTKPFFLFTKSPLLCFDWNLIGGSIDLKRDPLKIKSEPLSHVKQTGRKKIEVEGGGDWWLAEALAVDSAKGGRLIVSVWKKSHPAISDKALRTEKWSSLCIIDMLDITSLCWTSPKRQILLVHYCGHIFDYEPWP